MTGVQTCALPIYCKKNEIKPWLREQWCIPPKANADFVCAMEDVLEVYKRPRNKKRPQVCIDESSKQQVKEVRDPISVKKGSVEKYDSEYERNGVSNLFMMFAPLEGWRHVKVTDRRTKIDWAHCMKDLVDIHFPDVEKIILVEDNLNTHKRGSLYEAFPPEEARRILEKIEFHYTPKHGSWLNIAEIELSVLKRQCLAGRIDCIEKMRAKVAAWNTDRNNRQTHVDWQFGTNDARCKLKRLYPKF